MTIFFYEKFNFCLNFNELIGFFSGVKKRKMKKVKTFSTLDHIKKALKAITFPLKAHMLHLFIAKCYRQQTKFHFFIYYLLSEEKFLPSHCMAWHGTYLRKIIFSQQQQFYRWLFKCFNNLWLVDVTSWINFILLCMLSMEWVSEWVRDGCCWWLIYFII